jgi:hypothetical protein
MKVAFRTSSTIKQHVKEREKTTDIYSPSGAYRTVCKECSLKYIIQTGCTFRTGYKGIKMNGQGPKFVQHIEYGTQLRLYRTNHGSATYIKERKSAKRTGKLSYL